MVIDRKQVSLELTVPAADIVGFEREPANAAERASVDATLVKLADPMQLFSFSPDAGCTLTSSEAHFGDADDGDHGQEARPHDHEEHVAFAASYLLDCPQLNGATATLETQFFNLFNRAGALTVEGLVDGAPIQAVLSPQQPSTTLR